MTASLSNGSPRTRGLTVEDLVAELEEVRKELRATQEELEKAKHRGDELEAMLNHDSPQVEIVDEDGDVNTFSVVTKRVLNYSVNHKQIGEIGRLKYDSKTGLVQLKGPSLSSDWEVVLPRARRLDIACELATVASEGGTVLSGFPTQVKKHIRTSERGMHQRLREAETRADALHSRNIALEKTVVALQRQMAEHRALRPALSFLERSTSVEDSTTTVSPSSRRRSHTLPYHPDHSPSPSPRPQVHPPNPLPKIPLRTNGDTPPALEAVLGSLARLWKEAEDIVTAHDAALRSECERCHEPSDSASQASARRRVKSLKDVLASASRLPDLDDDDDDFGLDKSIKF